MGGRAWASEHAVGLAGCGDASGERSERRASQPVRLRRVAWRASPGASFIAAVAGDAVTCPSFQSASDSEWPLPQVQ